MTNNRDRVFASIDCGTNSIRLLVAKLTKTGELVEIERDNTIVRLGEGVDATGKFADAALARVDDALGEYANRMVAHGVEDVKMGATSATRDAANREEFFAITEKHLGRIRDGRVAEVISGQQEAALSFNGAVQDLAVDRSLPIGVVDLGGGSTEFIVRRTDEQGESQLVGESTDMGCVRITERLLRDDPATAAEIASAEEFVDEQLDRVFDLIDFQGLRGLVGVAGTMTTVAAITLGLEDYEPSKIHQTTLPLEDFRQTAVTLRDATVAERRAFGPMHPKRADVIGGGAIIIDRFARRLLDLGITEITISEKDILDGLLQDLIDSQPPR